jgi:hypothetical protein
MKSVFDRLEKIKSLFEGVNTGDINFETVEKLAKENLNDVPIVELIQNLFDIKCSNCKYFSRNIVGNRLYGSCMFVPSFCDEVDDVTLIAYIETYRDSMGEENSGELIVREDFFCKNFKEKIKNS